MMANSWAIVVVTAERKVIRWNEFGNVEVELVKPRIGEFACDTLSFYEIRILFVCVCVYVSVSDERIDDRGSMACPVLPMSHISHLGKRKSDAMQQQCSRRRICIARSCESMRIKWKNRNLKYFV